MNKQGKYQQGFALGKFLPPHKGHEAMLRFGLASCENFTIMICSIPSDPIPGHTRLAWLQELFPRATVVHLDNPTMPQEPKDHPDFWNIWRTTIQALVPGDIDAVYASEDYGWRLAEELGAQFVPFDLKRNRFPISGTAIRADPYQQWEYLPDPVRAYYTKRIAILGPESAGKSTLAHQLAEKYQTREVIEYARPLFDALVASGKRLPGEFRYEDLSMVAQGQMALEDTLARSSKGILICDTDVLTTMTWSQHLYGKVEPWIVEQASKRQYDLTLLLHPEDNAFVQDGQRIMDDLVIRVRFMERLCANLETMGRPYTILRSDKLNNRLDQAIAQVEAVCRSR